MSDYVAYGLQPVPLPYAMGNPSEGSAYYPLAVDAGKYAHLTLRDRVLQVGRSIISVNCGGDDGQLEPTGYARFDGIPHDYRRACFYPGSFNYVPFGFSGAFSTVVAELSIGWNPGSPFADSQTVPDGKYPPVPPYYWNPSIFTDSEFIPSPCAYFDGAKVHPFVLFTLAISNETHFGFFSTCSTFKTVPGIAAGDAGISLRLFDWGMDIPLTAYTVTDPIFGFLPDKMTLTTEGGVIEVFTPPDGSYKFN